MKVQHAKVLSLVIAAALFCLIYFGFSTVDRNKKVEMDRQRVLTAEVTGPEMLLKEAKSVLSSDSLALIGQLEHLTEGAPADTAAFVSNLKRLSGLWYNQSRYGLAGIYAQKVAEIEQNAEAWSIAGTTYGIGVKMPRSEKEKEFCAGRAVKAFEHAISLEPEQTLHRVNLASIYTDVPPQDNPMKGIQILLDLNDKEPDNTSVLNLLGHLAIKTGQFDRAIERLEHSYEINPTNVQTPCLLSLAYEGAGQHEKAHNMAEKCR